MDIWETLYNKAKQLYHPHDVSPFIYAENVVCALEADDGQNLHGLLFRSHVRRVSSLC